VTFGKHHQRLRNLFPSWKLRWSTGSSRPKYILLRLFYLGVVIGAGFPGLLTLLAPAKASDYLFNETVSVGPWLQILGSLWVAVAIAAVPGLHSPLRWLPVLLIQLLYKSIWVILIGLPEIFAGTEQPAIFFFTSLFSVWSVMLAASIPFDVLLKP